MHFSEAKVNLVGVISPSKLPSFFFFNCIESIFMTVKNHCFLT